MRSGRGVWPVGFLCSRLGVVQGMLRMRMGACGSEIGID